MSSTPEPSSPLFPDFMRSKILTEVQQEVEKLERFTPIGCGGRSVAAEEDGRYLSRQDVLDLLQRLKG